MIWYSFIDKINNPLELAIIILTNKSETSNINSCGWFTSFVRFRFLTYKKRIRKYLIQIQIRNQKFSETVYVSKNKNARIFRVFFSQPYKKKIQKQ